MISAELGEIYIRNGKYISSVQIAQQYNKRHKNVLRDIRSILKREDNFYLEFIEGVYVDSNSRMMPCFYISKKGEKRLHDRYKYNSRTASLEKSFYEWLRILFPNQNIIKQYPILNYRIDFYIKSLNIAIEYDENAHKYNKEKDILRQFDIQKEIPDIHFIRVKEGKEVEGIRELLLLIDELNGNPVKYMQF